jgi:transcriptional regulator with XRE-family HTH domain
MKRNMESDLRIGKRLQWIRETTRPGISQTQAAIDMGIKKGTLSNIEGDSRHPSLGLLIIMSKYYGVSTDFILGAGSQDTVDTTLAHLIATIRNLPKYRQRDLLAMAETFAAKNEEDDSQALRIVYDKAVKLGGESAGEVLLKLLGRLDLGSNNLKPLTLDDQSL